MESASTVAALRVAKSNAKHDASPQRWRHLAAALALSASACGRFGFETPCADGSGVCGADAGVDAAVVDAAADAAAADAAADADASSGPVIDARISDPDGDGQPDLVAFYSLDGCTPEDGWGSHDGVVVGTLTAEGDRTATADGACRFPSGAYVEVPYWAGLASPTFSVSIWARVDWAALFTFGSLHTWRDESPVAGYNLFALSDGSWEVYFAPNPPNPTGNPWNATQRFSGPQDDAWHHAVTTYDGQDVVVYVDGAEVARMASNYNNNHVRSMLIGMGVGTGGVLSYPFAGVLDELALYDRALSAGEVVAIHTR